MIWARAIEKPAVEFSRAELKVISGCIPPTLSGTLYRNGPARLERGDRRVGHWFDGDGAILAVHFQGGKASALYRYVQTEGYKLESQKNRYLFPNYGMTVPGFFWNNWGKEVKNSANTSVLALEDRLLALWEGGLPYRLDLETLETLGTDDLGGLDRDEPYSAHPKIDPLTGDIFNFGVSPGARTRLNVYRADRTGRINRKNSVYLDGLPLIHDFVLAGAYLIFFIPPVRVNVLPVLLGWSSYADAMEWRESLGTRVLVFDRDSLSLISEGVTDSWFQWHFANGYTDAEGNVEILFVGYDDFRTERFLKEVATGKTETLSKGTLRRVLIDPRSGRVIRTEVLHDRSCDFPVVSPRRVGMDWRKTYLSVHRADSDIAREIIGLPAVFDRDTGELTVANLENNCYASEPILVGDGSDPETGWIIVIVYNGDRHSSEARVYDGRELESEPLCRLELPGIIPPGFHGTWREVAV